MNASDLLDAARAAGVTLRAEGGRLLASPSGALPPALAEALRAEKAQVLALLTPPSGTTCGSPGARRVLPFDRRRRTELHLAGRSCPSCGSPDGWQVNARGDAWCRPCEARRAAEEARP